MDPAEAATLLLDKRKVMIITGAGLSAASGIPTFRGEGGFWTKSYPDVKRPEDMATRSYFTKHPEAKWHWIHTLR